MRGARGATIGAKGRAGDPITAPRAIAGRLPDTDEGIACAGTPLERVTARVRKKAFAFLGGGTVMLKLKESLPEAKKVAACKVGATGWVTAKLGAGAPPAAMLKRWLEESYRLVCQKPR